MDLTLEDIVYVREVKTSGDFDIWAYLSELELMILKNICHVRWVKRIFSILQIFHKRRLNFSRDLLLLWFRIFPDLQIWTLL